MPQGARLALAAARVVAAAATTATAVITATVIAAEKEQCKNYKPEELAVLENIT